MSWSRRLLWVLGFALASASVCTAEDGVRLRVIDPKPFYRPGDRIEIEVRCLGAVTEAPVVLYNPSPGGSESGFLVDDPITCPSSRFQIEIPRNFVGKNTVIAMSRQGEKRYGDTFEFEVRSDARPAGLWLSTSSQDEECHLSIFRQGPVPLALGIFSVMTDGTRFNLCAEGKVAVSTDPAGSASFAMENGSCSLTPRKTGAFKISVAYRDLRKEWPCTVDAPDEPRPVRPTALPVRKIAPDEFLLNPGTLDHHPAEVGLCRTVEHWDTGNCYVSSGGRGKVSEFTDSRCDDLPGLRRRMERAIRSGFCDSRAPEPGFVKPKDTHVDPSDFLPTKKPYVVPAAGAPGAPPRISLLAFRHDPRTLDRHPMDVGKCRLVEHHTTGYCYVYSLLASRKISEETDARCENLEEQRRRMRIAVDQGLCWPPGTGAAAGSSAPAPEKTPLEKTLAEMRQLAIFVESYNVDHASYPVAADVQSLVTILGPAGAPPVTDGWGTPFAYRSDGKSYVIVSAGADRTFEAESSKLGATLAGENDSPTRDLVFSDGRFLQWPRSERQKP